jgi:hypothetical protein
MASDETPGFPRATADERELLLSWLGYLRGAVIRKVEGLPGSGRVGASRLAFVVSVTYL